jgi:hypothetical protein
MSNDTELVVLFAMLHLIALAAGGGLLLLAFSGADGYGDAHPDRGSGGDQPPDPPGRPIGGPPLPVAVPARVRLRAPARLADLVPPAPRRAAREPNRPAPRPASTPTNRPSDPGEPRMFRDLLVAFDGSSHAQRALADARGLAQATAGRLKASPVPVLVVHVTDDPPNEQQ